MKPKIAFLVLLLSLLVSVIYIKNASASNNIKGRILLQVESRGEAWYVNPKDGKRYYMANGNEAFQIMKTLGVGVNNKDMNRIKTDANFRKKFIGKILLQVESRGEAYYISFDGRYNYLKDGASAYEVMKKLGLGISNKDLEKLVIMDQANITSSVIDCGSIQYKDMVFSLFSNSTSTEVSLQSKNSIKCINDSLASCSPSKFIVKGTNINPVFPDQKYFNVEDRNMVISRASDNSKCLINKCTVPKTTISNFYKVHGQATIFTLITSGHDGSASDIFDPVTFDPITKETLTNVCPAGENPYK